MRPQPAAWFEMLAARDDAAPALETLAQCGAVQLECLPAAHGGAMPGRLEQALRHFDELARRYRAYWPEAGTPSPAPGAPPAAMERALHNLRQWAEAADPAVARLQAAQREAGELRLWQSVLPLLEDAFDCGLAAQAGPVLAVKIFLFETRQKIALPPALLCRVYSLPQHDAVLAAGQARQLADFSGQAAQAKARVLDFPRWLRGSPHQAQDLLRARSSELDAVIATAGAQIAALCEKHALARTLGDALRAQWFAQNAGALPESENFVWVTGWCSDPAALRAALERSGRRAALRFPAAPQEIAPPLLLRNPRWARAYEIFSRALGMPGSREADPSQLLAAIVPLLFGYMFGDVGQGLTLAAAGRLLQKRHPAARILVGCGISAAAFGLLFGSVFGRHDWIAPLWLHPLDHPLAVLALPLAFGAVLLIAGQLLNGIEAYWQRRLNAWLCRDAGLLAIYCGVAGGVVQPQGYLLAWLGLAAYFGGCLWRERHLRALAPAAAHLLESALQLGVNTLSFARVGAFALAHAGLSLAVVALAAGGGAAGFFTLLLGNLLVIALEALLVTIQTARLVLFEFFIRFLRGEGRVFRPLPAPSYLLARRTP